MPAPNSIPEAPPVKPSVTGLWIGDTLPILSELCIRSYQDHGFHFRLLTYGKVSNVPDYTEIQNAGDVLPPDQLFTHSTGSLAPTADRIRYKYLAEQGGLWTDMDVACLAPFRVSATPWFGLQEPGLANLAVLQFPARHDVMTTLAERMADPAAPMPWDGDSELQGKAAWRANIPDVKQRQIHAEWSLGGPEGFTEALKHFGIFELAAPSETFNPVHYTGWRWIFDGTFALDNARFDRTSGIHLWAEMLRREPDALENLHSESVVGQLLRKHRCATGAVSFRRPQVEGTSRPRILVGICSCRKYPDKRQAVRDTWLSFPAEGVECQFFIGGEGRCEGEPDTVVVDAEDSYEALPQKVIAFFRKALSESDFDWLFKCDDDTYLALDRLHDLVGGDWELVGNEFLNERGSPSGGAGYLLSRRMVELLVNDSTIPPTGIEDILIGEAAVRHGARTHATDRLCSNTSRFPHARNQVITSHWCDPDRLRSIHTLRFLKPFEVQAVHSYWNDRMLLYPNGYFSRYSTGCCGTWRRQDHGVIRLEWEGWGVEYLIPDGASAVSDDIPFPYESYRCQASPSQDLTLEAGTGPKLVLPVDSDGRVRPWMSDAEIDLIDSYLQPDWSVIEYGAGGSTLYFSTKVRRWDSIEHSAAWAAAINEALDEQGVQRASVISVPIATPAVITGPYPDGYLASFEEYVQAILRFPIPNAVLVDGRARLACMRAALSRVGKDGLIFIHDFSAAGRERYNAILSEAKIITQTGGLAVLRPR